MTDLQVDNAEVWRFPCNPTHRIPKMNLQIDRCLFYSGNRPAGLDAWCSQRGVEASVYALFDGGGDCGSAVEFPSAELRRQAEAEFPPRAHNFPMGEMLSYVGKIGVPEV